MYLIFLFYYFFSPIQLQKNEMGEVTVEYGAIYWTHNQTLYPTTTTTTTVSIFSIILCSK